MAASNAVSIFASAFAAALALAMLPACASSAPNASKPAFATKSAAPDLAQVAASGLNEQQAQQVLRLALKQSKYRKYLASKHGYIEDGFVNQDGTPTTPGFYKFRLAYDAPGAAMTWYYGPFLVSQKTGDVWDVSLTPGCVNFHSGALARIQVAIMKKTKAVIQDEAPLRKDFDCRTG